MRGTEVCASLIKPSIFAETGGDKRFFHEKVFGLVPAV